MRKTLVAAGMVVAILSVAALLRALWPVHVVDERRAAKSTAETALAPATTTTTPAAGDAKSGTDGAQQEEVTTTSHPDDITALEVDNDSGDVEVTPGPTKVVRTELWTVARQTVTETVRDGVLKIIARCPQPALSGNACSTRFQITAPRGVLLSLHVSAGNITARGFSGDQDLATSAGSVSALEASARHVSARSSAGTVVVDMVAAPDRVQASTSSGNVLVTVPADRYAVTANTTSGHTEVGVQQDPSAPHRIDATTSSGNVEVRAR